MVKASRIARYAESLNIGLTVNQELGSGSFGAVYSGRYKGDKVAVKFERIRRGDETLETEYSLYKFLFQDEAKPYVGIPRPIFYHSDHKKYRLLVMPFYGYSLKQLMTSAPNHKFSEQTTALIALQVLNHLEFIHERGLAHRDAKPANLLVGSNDGFGTICIYMVDFGLSKVVVDPQTKQHISNRQYHGITGTLRYLGIHAHQSQEASRRDDIQSLSYMLIYFLKGYLPWQSLIDNERTPSKQREQRQQKRRQRTLVYNMKKDTKTSELCRGLPDVFGVLLDYSLQLKFEEMPDYPMLKKLFFRFLKDKYGGVNWGEFDWTKW